MNRHRALTIFLTMTKQRLIAAVATTLLALAAACKKDDPASPPSTTVTVTPNSLSIVGISQSAELRAVVSGGASAVTWKSSDVTVADVSPGGASATVTSRGKGSATITATAGGISSTATVQVQADLRRVILSKDSIALAEARDTTLSATFEADPGVTVTYSWTSSQPAIVSVSGSGASAQATALASGVAKVVVAATSPFGDVKSDTVIVTVTGYSVRLAPDSLTLEGADSRRVKVEVLDPLLRPVTPQSITLAVDAPTVIAVNTLPSTSEIRVRGISTGVATITVRTNLSNQAVVLRVRVLPCVRTGDQLRWPLCGDDRSKVIRGYAEFGTSPTGPPAHHSGLDISDDNDAPVFASAAGSVVLVQLQDRSGCPTSAVGCRDRALGNTVIVKHSIAGKELYTQYSHLRAIADDLLAACSPPVSPGTRCAPNRAIADGELVGWVGRSGAGDSAYVSVPQLHFEVKARGVLHNPRSQGVDTPIDESACSPGSCAWEYVGAMQSVENQPDALGYDDPKLLFHANTNLYSAVLAERRVVSVEGAGRAIRFGPGSYPASTQKTVAGQGYIVTAQTPPLPGCGEGWVKIINDDGSYYTGPGSGASPEGWICAGDGGVTYARSPRVLSESVFASQTELYSVEVSPRGTDRLVTVVQDPNVFDIAITPNGELYGVTVNTVFGSGRNTIVRIDSATGVVTPVVQYFTTTIGAFNGLVATRDGKLLIGTDNGYLLLVDPHASPPAQATAVAHFAGYAVWGDMTYGPDGKVYVSTVLRGSGVLLKVDPTSYALLSAVPMSGLAGGAVLGLVFSGKQLVGLVWDSSTSGRLVRVDPVSGVATTVRALGFGSGGATLVGSRRAFADGPSRAGAPLHAPVRVGDRIPIAR